MKTYKILKDLYDQQETIIRALSGVIVDNIVLRNKLDTLEQTYFNQPMKTAIKGPILLIYDKNLENDEEGSGWGTGCWLPTKRDRHNLPIEYAWCFEHSFSEMSDTYFPIANPIAWRLLPPDIT